MKKLRGKRMVENKRVERGRNRVLDETCMEYVTDVIPTPDFVEVHGRSGGDDLCFRVYDNGEIYER